MPQGCLNVTCKRSEAIHGHGRIASLSVYNDVEIQAACIIHLSFE
jgi:hypothetical protein